MSYTSFQNTYGTYVYNDQLEVLQEGVQARLQVVSTPGRNGGYSEGGKVENKRVTLRGKVFSTDVASGQLRDAWDAFKCAHAPGPQRFLAIDSDRYLSAEVESLEETEWDSSPHRDFTVTLLAVDPFWYANSSTIQTLTTDGSKTTFSTLGNAPVQPLLYLNLTGSGGNVIISVNGNQIVVTPDQIGAIFIDSLNQWASIGSTSGPDVSYMLSGVFAELQPGLNSVIVTATTAVVSSAQISWQDKWY